METETITIRVAPDAARAFKNTRIECAQASLPAGICASLDAHCQRDRSGPELAGPLARLRRDVDSVFNYPNALQRVSA